VVIGLGIVLAFLGGLVILQGVRGLGRSFTAVPYPRDDGALVREGIYAHIRHPIYAGTIGLALGWACITLSATALAAALVLVVVLDLKARREEAWLADRYPDYDAYRAATHRFVPGLY
jgi:protein-S-isoprenylcysteine O-methyltransferase Ste14